MRDELNPEDLPPAYFLSLALENVRCFGPEQTLDLTDDEGNPAQWTVLLGDNGTGKTTLLQAVAVLEVDVEWDDELKEMLRDHFPDDEGFWKEEPAIFRFNKKGAQTSFRRSETQEAILSAKYFFGSKLSDTAGGYEPLRRFELRQKGKRQISCRGYPDTDDMQGLFCVGYGASRAMSAGGMTGGMEYEGGSKTLSLFSDSGLLPNVEEWLHELNYAAESGKQKARKRLEKVTSVLASSGNGILPDVDDLRFGESDEDISPPQVEFHTPYGWVSIDRLSLGYRTMIAWVVDLARRLFKRYPESDNPLSEPAVCLVDEIDLHLHPKWQRKIIDFLSERFPNTQFIVTAHSPLVVQAAQDANIALLKRVEVEDGDDYVKIHNDMEPVGNLRVDQILTSDLYGLESARPPQVGRLLEEREEILSKSELTDEDEERLDEIEEEIGDLPSGETKEQREAMDFIESVADRLEKEGEGTS